MKNLGGMGAMLDKLPGMGGMAQAAQNVDTKQFDRMEAMINSMTPKERRNPDLIFRVAQTAHYPGFRHGRCRTLIGF